MKVGDVVYAKSFDHREAIQITEGKNGKSRVQANRYGFKFQGEHNLTPTIGVFLYLGTHPECVDSSRIYSFAESQLRRLGWYTESDREGDK